MFAVPSETAGLPEIARAVRNLFRGRMNCTGEVALSTGTTTEFKHPSIGPTSCITVVPLTAGAAMAGAWVSAQGGGAATITHAAGDAGRMVRYAVIG